jgi:hypothetical protein
MSKTYAATAQTAELVTKSVSHPLNPGPVLLLVSSGNIWAVALPSTACDSSRLRTPVSDTLGLHKPVCGYPCAMAFTHGIKKLPLVYSKRGNYLGYSTIGAEFAGYR